jgi:uracil-DNA glycosylase
LAFSVAPGVRLPPSLQNIFRKSARPGHAISPFRNRRQPGEWAQNGVLLLSTCLTVEGQAASHSKRLELLTDAIIRQVAEQEPTVFMLWGSHAQSSTSSSRRTAVTWC